MKQYEITFITKEDQKEKPIKAILEALGGKILNISSLGQKTFTYPIKKEKSGVYTTVNLEIAPEKVMDLNKKLGLEEEILRFLMISAPLVKDEIREIKPAEKIIETKEIIEAPAKKIEIAPEAEIVVVEEKPEEVIEKPKKIVKEKVIKEKPFDKAQGRPVKVSKAVKELIEEPVSEEARLDALDKKLEELLKE